MIFISVWFIYFFSLIYLLSEREKESRGRAERGRERERERERERIPSRLCTEPDAGLELTNCEVMT